MEAPIGSGQFVNASCSRPSRDGPRDFGKWREAEGAGDSEGSLG